MNSKFTDEQIEAYAAQFRVGDAIWCDGEWQEVVEIKRNGDNRITAYVDGNIFVINDGEDEEYYSESPYGFTKKGLNEKPYRVTTLKEYDLQGDEKIIWLGESDDFRTFGKSYKVDERKRYSRDDGISVFILSDSWGIIPRHEQVKNLGKTTITEKVNQVVRDGMNNERPASSHYHTNNNGNDVWQFADDNLSSDRVKGFHQINAIKYVSRYNKKHDTAEKRIEDLEKAKVSIDKLIALEKNQ